MGFYFCTSLILLLQARQVPDAQKSMEIAPLETAAHMAEFHYSSYVKSLGETRKLRRK
jgi:hypothetical protein